MEDIGQKHVADSQEAGHVMSPVDLNVESSVGYGKKEGDLEDWEDQLQHYLNKVEQFPA